MQHFFLCGQTLKPPHPQLYGIAIFLFQEAKEILIRDHISNMRLSSSF